MRVSDEELVLLERYGGTSPVRLRQLVDDLREARDALREIAARPCTGPDVSAPCYKFFGDDNRDKWCDSCIAFKAVEGGAT